MGFFDGLLSLGSGVAQGYAEKKRRTQQLMKEALDRQLAEKELAQKAQEEQDTQAYRTQALQEEHSFHQGSLDVDRQKLNRDNAPIGNAPIPGIGNIPITGAMLDPYLRYQGGLATDQARINHPEAFGGSASSEGHKIGPLDAAKLRQEALLGLMKSGSDFETPEQRQQRVEEGFRKFQLADPNIYGTAPPTDEEVRKQKIDAFLSNYTTQEEVNGALKALSLKHPSDAADLAQEIAPLIRSWPKSKAKPSAQMPPSRVAPSGGTGRSQY